MDKADQTPALLEFCPARPLRPIRAPRSGELRWLGVQHGWVSRPRTEWWGTSTLAGGGEVTTPTGRRGGQEDVKAQK